MYLGRGVDVLNSHVVHVSQMTLNDRVHCMEFGSFSGRRLAELEMELLLARVSIGIMQW